MRFRQAGLYGRTVARVAQRGFREPGGDPEFATERIVFVVGSPRSGTTFLADAVGSQPGFVDLGEVRPVKSSIKRWATLPEDKAATELRSTLERIRRLGFVRDLRPVEQTPELSFVVGAAVRAYPRATVLHIIRDGRDVVCSLLERGWLREREGHDDAGQPYGPHPAPGWSPSAVRSSRAREATRAAWAWRRYLTAARAAPEHRSRSATRRSRPIRRPSPSGSQAGSRRIRRPSPRRSVRSTAARSAAGVAI